MRTGQLRALVAGVGLLGVAGLLATMGGRPAAPEPSAPPAQAGAGGADAPSPARAGMAPDAGGALDAGPPQRWDLKEPPGWKVGVAMRPMDHDIFDVLLSGHVERARMLDVFPDRPYRVQLAGSGETGRFRFVLIDLDRDGKWDEKWDLVQPGQVHRVVTHDPGAMGRQVEYTITRGRWQPH